MTLEWLLDLKILLQFFFQNVLQFSEKPIISSLYNVSINNWRILFYQIGQLCFEIAIREDYLGLTDLSHERNVRDLYHIAHYTRTYSTLLLKDYSTKTIHRIT